MESILAVHPRPINVIEKNDTILNFMVIFVILNTWELTRLGIFIFRGRNTQHILIGYL